MKGLKVAGIFVGGWVAGTVINVKLIKKLIKFIENDKEIGKIFAEAVVTTLDRNKESVIEIITDIMRHYGYDLKLPETSKEENKDEQTESN